MCPLGKSGFNDKIKIHRYLRKWVSGGSKRSLRLLVKIFQELNIFPSWLCTWFPDLFPAHKEALCCGAAVETKLAITLGKVVWEFILLQIHIFPIITMVKLKKNGFNKIKKVLWCKNLRDLCRAVFLNFSGLSGVLTFIFLEHSENPTMSDSVRMDGQQFALPPIFFFFWELLESSGKWALIHLYS